MRWCLAVIVAIGIPPHAWPRRPMLAPFASGHMQLANGAAQIWSVFVGELRGSGPAPALRQRGPATLCIGNRQQRGDHDLDFSPLVAGRKIT